MMSNTRFIAVVGAAIVVMIGILLYQKILRCNEAGGTACCFGRMCNQIVKPAPKGDESQP
jgi:hypothetical protein